MAARAVTRDFPALAAWLERLEARNPREIELGLDRTREVLARLAPDLANVTVITVAGTNGKGSTVAFLDALFRAAGYSVLSYTSPHILHFGERMRLDGHPVSDQAIVSSLDRVESCRGSTPLTYFEHTTLALLDQAGRKRPDVLVLEVGLGGRLDAVNVIDPDVAIVTGVDFDHQEWLGDDLDAIGREKAGIARPDRPLVIGQRIPPAGLLTAARQANARIVLAGRDFDWHEEGGSWHLTWPGGCLKLPLPAMAGAHQAGNAACAWMASRCLEGRLGVTPAHLESALASARPTGRFQQVGQAPEIVLDVAHNLQAATGLAEILASRPRRTFAVLGMLADKDAAGVARALDGYVERWLCAGLVGPRGRSGGQLAECLSHIPVTGRVEALESIPAALDRALDIADRSDRVLVLGSFLSVGEALNALNRSH